MLDLKNWYVIYTRPHHEKRVVNEIGLMDNYECFLPLRPVLRKWSDRIKQMMEPIFSNYVFVKSTDKQRIPLFQVSGVVKFLHFDGRAVTLRESEIERMRLLETNGKNIEQESYLCAGKEIVINRGPFAGVSGTIIRRTNHSRLLIRIPLLKQAVSVQLEEEDICEAV